jgi:hypothetical protein
MHSINKLLKHITQISAKLFKILFVLIVAIFILIIPLRVSAWLSSIGFKIFKKCISTSLYFNKIKYKK